MLGGSLRNGLAGRGFQDKLEDLEGVGVFGGGSRDTESVSGWEDNLVTVSKIVV